MLHDTIGFVELTELPETAQEGLVVFLSAKFETYEVGHYTYINGAWKSLGGATTDGESSDAFGIIPGPSELLYGDNNAGYFGEFDAYSSNFITPLSATLSARRQGIVFDSAAVSGPGGNPNNNSIWLKFAYKGHILLVAKEPSIKAISYHTLQRDGLMFGGHTLEKDGINYSVRAIRGADTGYNLTPPGVGEGEYGNLIVPLLNGVWESDAEVGAGTWCQEVRTASPNARAVIREGQDVTLEDVDEEGYTRHSFRPVLEITNVVL